MLSRIKGRVGAALDRRYVRRERHEADLARCAEQLARLAERADAADAELVRVRGLQDGGPAHDARQQAREARRLADESARAIESVLQTELRLWQRIDALHTRLEALEHAADRGR